MADVGGIEPVKFFSGAGVHPVPGHEKNAEPIIRKLEEIGVNRVDFPWFMAEFVFANTNASELPEMRQVLGIQMATAQLFCPTPVDPDCPPTAEFPHPFVIGDKPDLNMCVLSGTTSEKVLAAFKKYGQFYFEIHLWVKPKDGSEPKAVFLQTIVDAGPVKIVGVSSDPVIIPVDSSVGWRCMYARRKGWAPEIALTESTN